mmetsp:Transcript_33494/g.88186  ORF Transcript_33494/g.88186 Transcript_33494/m.88186 type:complete len:103 (-) Transcript_33494:523-831(-)
MLETSRCARLTAPRSSATVPETDRLGAFGAIAGTATAALVVEAYNGWARTMCVSANLSAALIGARNNADIGNTGSACATVAPLLGCCGAKGSTAELEAGVAA